VVEEVAAVVEETIIKTVAKTTSRDLIIMRILDKGLLTMAIVLVQEMVVEVGLGLPVQIPTARVAIIQLPSLPRIHPMVTTSHPTTSSLTTVA